MRSLLLVIALVLGILPEAEAARVKDVATLYGVRTNSLYGYGLVTGLNRTGDGRSNESSVRALANRLQGLGFTVSTDEIVARNVAVVMVTAEMPSSARAGHRLDVVVSSTGDATSLEGGVLQFTPLYAPNGEPFATAQGPLIVGGFQAAAAGSSVQKNHTTTARVTQGAVIEKENPNRLVLDGQKSLQWIVNEPDFTTATRLAEAINTLTSSTIATALDGAAVKVDVPESYRGREVALVAEIERAEVEIDRSARVVVNERTGTVVMGADVRISPVAVAHGGLTIEVQATNEVSQPNLLAQGETTRVQNAGITVDQEQSRLTMLEGATIGELVAALNDIGIRPRDLIQVLMAIHAAGALHAEIEVM